MLSIGLLPKSNVSKNRGPFMGYDDFALLSVSAQAKKAASLQILGSEPRAFGYPGQHSRPYLVLVVKCKYVISKAGTSQHFVGSSGLAFDGPADTQECGKNRPRLRGWPLAHAETANNSSSPGMVSPWSSLSAMTRSARASARMMASSRVAE